MRTFYYSTEKNMEVNYIAVNSSGGSLPSVIKSNDGIIWDNNNISITDTFIDIIWDGSKFVTVNSGQCYTSTNGITWNSVSLGGSGNKIFYNGNIYVVFTSSPNIRNYVLTSTDCITWTQRSLSKNETLHDVIWDGSKFVAVGDECCYTSTDGLTWTQRTIPSDCVYQKIIYNGSIYVAVGGNSASGSPAIVTSTNAITWTTRQTNATLRDVIWDGSKFIAIGGNGAVNYCYTSTNGLTWTSQTVPDGVYYKIITNGSIYVAVGDTSNSSANTIITSTDGVTWTSRLTKIYSGFRYIIWDGSKFITLGSSSTFPINFRCYTSTDGITWSYQTIPQGTYQKIVQKT